MNKKVILRISRILVRMITLLFAVSLVTFILITASPIDPIDAYVGSESGVSQEQRDNVARYWGLDKPPAERYFIWLGNITHGDMGISTMYRMPVHKVIGERFLSSIVLMGVAWLLSGIIGFTLGVISGAKEGSIIDKAVKMYCFILSSTPAFWVGLIILMVFAVFLGWFPIALSTPIGKLAGEVTLSDKIHHLILPALTLSLTGISGIALHTRQKIIDVLKSDYVLYAKARGQSKWEIIWRHCIRNILLPAVTLQFLSFSELFGGSVLVEQVFSYPGLGNTAAAAGLKGDISLFLGIALFSAIFVFTGNFIADVLYSLLNPQSKEAESYEK